MFGWFTVAHDKVSVPDPDQVLCGLLVLVRRSRDLERNVKHCPNERTQSERHIHLGTFGDRLWTILKSVILKFILTFV